MSFLPKNVFGFETPWFFDHGNRKRDTEGTEIGKQMNLREYLFCKKKLNMIIILSS